MNTLVSADIKEKERKKNGANGKGENGRWANVKGQDKGTGEWNGVNGGTEKSKKEMKGVNRKRQKKGLGKGKSGNKEWEWTMEQK